MKTLSAIVLLAMAIPGLAFGQAKPQRAAAPAGSAAVEEVTALERAWIDAARRYDVAWFERALADSFVNTDENGAATGKAAMVADVKNRASKTESMSYEDLKVQAYGDAAVATGITVVKGGSYQGKDNSGRYRWTDTWVKRGGQWQCVASHASKIPADLAGRDLPDISGTYNLVSFNGHELPYEFNNEGAVLVIRSGAFTIKADGTCISATTISLPTGAEATREVAATYTREGSKLTMQWVGAGTTFGAADGKTFTMDNEGMTLTYRK
jgi:ketosteroid isomerase-like protein